MKIEEKDKETKELAEILSSLQNIYEQKREHLKQLQTEVNDLRVIIRNLNSIISTKSFTSADQLFNKTSSQEVGNEEPEEEEFFHDSIQKEKFKDTRIKRKIFSDDEEEGNLLAILNFNNLDNLEIKFFNPKEKNIKETSERFIRLFLKDALIQIKESNPDIEVKYDFYKNSEFIEKVSISHLQSVDEFDLITTKVKELLE